MIIYLDLIFIINLIFDMCLLITVDLTLLRNAKWLRLFIGGLFGELSMITLFINFNSLTLFIFKILLSIIMCIIAFNYKDLKYTFYNVVYMYFIGIVLGGFITYLYNEFRINPGLSIKYILILSMSPIVLLVYYALIKRFKNNYNNRYRVVIDYCGIKYVGMGFLDSGNKLVSPISGKPIILIEKEYITLHKLKLLPVPYNALNHHGIINCFKPDSVSINDKTYKNVLIGLSEVKFNIDGCSILLNARMENI